MKSNSDCKRFLETILPYSQIKKEQIKLGLEFINLGRTGNGRNVNKKTWEFKRIYKTIMEVLNLRGSNAIENFVKKYHPEYIYD
jgi:hypothetical protein